MAQRKLRWIVVTLLVTAAAIGAWAYRQHHRYKHFAVHEDGRVYRSGWLAPEALSDVVDEYGIKAVINLCREDEYPREEWRNVRKAASDAGAQVITLPMPRCVDPSHPIIERYIDVLRDENCYPMLVHCQHGVTRTARMLSMYDVMIRGIPAGESLSAQPLFGRDGHSRNVTEFVANFEQKHRQLFPGENADKAKLLAE